MKAMGCDYYFPNNIVCRGIHNKKLSKTISESGWKGVDE